MSPYFWVGFHLFILAMIYLDLKVFHKNVKAITLKKTGLCCLFWIALALSFNAFLFWDLGFQPGLTFFTAYILEASLSIDNLFVFLAIFSFFRISSEYQHRVLFFGILGALICRIIFIVIGIGLLHHFSWMYFVFGAILCVSAIVFYKQKEEKDLKDSILLRGIRKYLPLEEGPHQGRFWIKKRGKIYFTTLFVALLFIEASDIIFAIDSIPAVLAITSNPFLAYTSNVFAVLGLRSFYFFLESLHKKFSYLKLAIVLILLFVGLKMLLLHVLAISTEVSLAIIGAIILIAILLSKKEKAG